MVEFENLLRRIDCRVTIPYWNWTKNRITGGEDLVTKTSGTLGIMVWEEMEACIVKIAWRTDLSAKINGAS